MAELVAATRSPPAERFIGDALYSGGNDYAVHEAGTDTVSVLYALKTRRVTGAITMCLA
jgi:hypothetical protein